jgi:hypothetical protein
LPLCPHAKHENITHQAESGMEEVGIAEIDEHARQDREAQADPENPTHGAKLLALPCLLSVEVALMFVRGNHGLISYSAA